MRRGLAVIGDAIEIDGAPAGLAAHGALHVVLRRGGIVGGGVLGELTAQGDGAAFAHQPCRRESLLRGDEVDGAYLVIVAPTAPIAVFLEICQDFFFRRHSTLHVLSSICLYVPSHATKLSGR